MRADARTNWGPLMKAILIAAVLGMSISMSYAAGNPQQELAEWPA